MRAQTDAYRYRMPDTVQLRFGPRRDIREFFAADRHALSDLLPTLTGPQWHASTAAAPWLVRDVVAHMIGDDLARLARTRDRYASSGPDPGELLAAYLHRHNAQWVAAYQRVSVRTLMDLLEMTTSQVLRLWQHVDLDAIGEPVSWVSPDPAPVWLDCGRDFTEYWIHQEQIRDAIRRPRPADPQLTHAVLDILFRALPAALRGVSAAPGTSVEVIIPDDAGGTWRVTRVGDEWQWAESAGEPAASVTMSSDAAWRLCTRALDPDSVRAAVTIVGDRELATAVLGMVSIIR
jgi:uncharacterized protein (TIGR03083 family)